MKISADDYEAYKGFFVYFVALFWPMPSPDVSPVAALAKCEARSPSKARIGLAEAIGDCLEMSESLSDQQVMLADQHLRQEGLPTLSYLRARHRAGVDAVLKRGTIRNEREYRAVRNVVEITAYEDEKDRLWTLLDDFEQRQNSN